MAARRVPAPVLTGLLAAVLAGVPVAGCAAGEDPVQAVISAELDRELKALGPAGPGEVTLTSPGGLGWDTVYVFGRGTRDEEISKVVGDPVRWEEQDASRSSSELMVFVAGGEAVGAYEIAVGFGRVDYRRPLHREVRLATATGADAAVRVVGQ
ncbi:hypothetical protein ACGFZP_31460 [Kitasatospora sp. NPDC048239]|uniref:hypothetical protein n=1 Tax=Kitasatospora sp. NPDC048239 TaxID=3364046 RepID=UPI0037101169